MNVLVSACLLGLSCRYDGQSKGHPLAGDLVAKHTAIPVCPEIFGGLSTPRPPSERRCGGVFTREGMSPPPMTGAPKRCCAWLGSMAVPWRF